MYTKTVMLDKASWYESKVIYPVSLVDNTAAFTNLSGNSFNKLNKMIFLIKYQYFSKYQKTIK